MTEVYDDGDRPEVASIVPIGSLRICDVGCYRGAFGASLKAGRPDRSVWGIEPNSEAANVAATRLDRVIVGQYPDSMPSGEVFDCITFNDVLEHMRDPWLAVRASREFLSSDGCVVAAIPNIRHYSVLHGLIKRGEWRYTDGGLLDRTHLRFFTRSSMIELFEQAGYHIRDIRAANLSNHGRIAALLRSGGSRTIEFRALHFVLLAYPGA